MDIEEKLFEDINIRFLRGGGVDGFDKDTFL